MSDAFFPLSTNRSKEKRFDINGIKNKKGLSPKKLKPSSYFLNFAVKLKILNHASAPVFSQVQSPKNELSFDCATASTVVSSPYSSKYSS